MPLHNYLFYRLRDERSSLTPNLAAKEPSSAVTEQHRLLYGQMWEHVMAHNETIYTPTIKHH